MIQKRLLLLVACAFALAPASRLSSAQDPGRVELVMVDVPLRDALVALMQRTRIEILFETDLVTGRRASCRITTSDPEEALGCLLRDTGLDYVTLSSGVHVLVEEALRAPVLASVLGRVLDAAAGTPVSRAHVRDLTTGGGTVTDGDGRFVLGEVRSGPHLLAVSHVAYEPRRDTIWVAQQTVHATLSMHQRVLDTQAILVSGIQTHPVGHPDVDLAGILENAQALAIGAMGGADGVVGFQSDPGGGGSHIEGGAPGDHAVLLDGTPIFIPLRNGGVFGPFSPLAVRSLTVHRAGFRAREGSSLAGGIDAVHALTRSPGQRLVAQISPLSSNLWIGRKTGAVSWMIAGRNEMGKSIRPASLDKRLREWSRPDRYLAEELFGSDQADLAQLSGILEDRDIIISYADLHAAADAPLGSGRRMYVSAYLADNRFGTPVLETSPFDFQAVSDEYVWQNKALQARYSWLAGQRTLMRAGTWTSSFILKHPFEQSPQGGTAASTSEFNEIVSGGGYVGLETSRSPRFAFSAEAGVRNLDADAQMGIDPRSEGRQLLPEGQSQMRWLWETTLDSDWTPHPDLRVTLGTRLTYHHGRRTVYAEPRLGIERRARFGQVGVTGRLSAGVYRQFINQVDVASWSFSAILPTFRTWLPLNRSQGPATALHLAAEVVAAASRGLSFTLQTYQKRMLRVYELGVLQTDPALVEGSGRARGISGAGRWELGRFTMALSHEWSLSRRSLPGRFGGESVSTPWAQPHRSMAQVSWKTAGRWSASARVERIGGRSWAFRRAYYNYLPAGATNAVFNVARPDRDGLPVHIQFDVSFGKTWEFQPATVTLRLDVLNVADARNVVEYRQDRAGGIVEIPGLPRLAAMTLRLGI